MPLNISNYTSDILSNISFELKAGENLIILGSNGAGKTTLAKVLCGIIPSDAVAIDTIIPSKVFGKRRAKLINYIPPKLDIFDAYITVREFLELGVTDGAVEAQPSESIDGALQKLHIAHLADKSCTSLSSGEAQLLLVASALLHNARYTIFDEPTANLDPQKIQLLFGLLQETTLLQSKLIITHNLNFAYKLGYNILFLNKGTVAFYGSHADFFDPAHLDMCYQGAVINSDNNIVVKL